MQGMHIYNIYEPHCTGVWLHY